MSSWKVQSGVNTTRSPGFYRVVPRVRVARTLVSSLDLDLNLNLELGNELHCYRIIVVSSRTSIICNLCLGSYVGEKNKIIRLLTMLVAAALSSRPVHVINSTFPIGRQQPQEDGCLSPCPGMGPSQIYVNNLCTCVNVGHERDLLPVLRFSQRSRVVLLWKRNSRAGSSYLILSLMRIAFRASHCPML